jgi:hypothetical protein
VIVCLDIGNPKSVDYIRKAPVCQQCPTQISLKFTK